MKRIQVQFTCEASRYNELKDKAVWLDYKKQIVIEKNKRSKRKEGWIEKLVMEIANATQCDDIVFNETEESIIIEFYDCVFLGGMPGEFQEKCYKSLSYRAELVDKVMRKFRIKNYILTHIFEPLGLIKEDDEKTFLDEKDIVYSGDDNFVLPF